MKHKYFSLTPVLSLNLVLRINLEIYNFQITEFRKAAYSCASLLFVRIYRETSFYMHSIYAVSLIHDFTAKKYFYVGYVS
jgi:hypothetical protein